MATLHTRAHEYKCKQLKGQAKLQTINTVREVEWVGRRVAADALAVAVLVHRRVDVAAVPPGTAADIVEALAGYLSASARATSTARSSSKRHCQVGQSTVFSDKLLSASIIRFRHSLARARVCDTTGGGGGTA
jgi:hypothetical protein